MRITRTSDPTDDAHGHYLAGILTTVEQLVTHSSELRTELATDRGVKLRGARYYPLPAALLVSSPRRVLTSTSCRWLGYMLTETSGLGSVLVQFADGNSDSDQPIGSVLVPAGDSRQVFPGSGFGVTVTSGLVISAISSSNPAAQVTGSVFLR